MIFSLGLKHKRVHCGFTLVELVTTILIVGIIAVFVIPRLIPQSSYSAYSLRNEFISELRQVQLRAMNNSDRCYDINVTPTGYQLRHYSGRNGNACSGPPLRTEQQQDFPSEAYVSLIAGGSQNFTVTFDSLGRLTQPACSGACFNIVADETLVVAVESEGYIHAM